MDESTEKELHKHWVGKNYIEKRQKSVTITFLKWHIGLDQNKNISAC